jgi:ATP-binding cassette, subfamily B, bacterial MsbA
MKDFFKTISTALGTNTQFAIVLLIIIILSSFFEALGISLVIPVLEILTTNVGVAEEKNEVGFFVNILNSYVDQEKRIFVISSILIIVFLIKNVLLFIREISIVDLQYKLIKFWSSSLLFNYLSINHSLFIKQKKGTMLNNIINEPQTSRRFLSKFCIFISHIILSISLYIALLLVNFEITLLVSSLALISFYIYSKISIKATKGIGSKRLSLMQGVTKSAEQSLIGIKHLKMLNRINEVLEIFNQKFTMLIKIQKRMVIYKSIPRPLGEMIILFLFFGFINYISYFTNASLIGFIPVLAFTVIAVNKLHYNLSAIISLRIELLSIYPSIKLISKNLSEVNLIKDRTAKKTYDFDFQKEVNFKDVSFFHNKDIKVLDNINLSINKNTITAIAGPSGSGKSTILDLLCAFYDSYEGQITIDNKEIREIESIVLRQNISYVDEKDFFIDQSIRQNLLLANSKATDKDMFEALKISESLTFVEALPFGVDEELYENAGNLSAGQRQRLMIARAFIRKTQLVVFDEATSFLDLNSSNSISKSLQELKKQRTLIIVTHRLETLKNVDLIYYLKNGKIIESGNFDELVAKKGEFYKALLADNEKL